MNKDITEFEVKNVTVVIKPGEEGEHWSVYLVNENAFPIKDILVASKGYGEKSKDQEHTSTIRQFFEEVPAKSAIQIELIDPKVFHLFNEYGVTYYIGSEIYFKKFVFVPDSIIPDNLVNHDILNAKVVLHD
jgi:hypothetical protein